jgi:hypothetical protein
MRPLIIGALAASLAGCSSFAPLQMQQAYTKPFVHHHSVTKTKKTIAAKKRNPLNRRTANAHAEKANAHSKNAKSNFDTKSAIAEAQTPQSSRLGDNGAMIKKAEASVAAKMENPASIEFIKMKRVAGKDTLSNSIDTICGYVRGEDTGEWRFLYLVQEDKVYIGRSIIATTQYRDICS